MRIPFLHSRPRVHKFAVPVPDPEVAETLQRKLEVARKVRLLKVNHPQPPIQKRETT